MNVVMTGTRRASSRCRAPPRRSRSPRRSSTSMTALRCATGIATPARERSQREAASNAPALRRARERPRRCRRASCVATTNRGKLARARALLAPRGVEVVVARTRRASQAGPSSRTARPSRRTPAPRPRDLARARRRCPRSATTPASRSTRSTARRACARRATPATRATDAENVAQLLRRAAPTCRTAHAAPRFAARSSLALARRRRDRRGRGHAARARSPARRAGSGGFGYDPVFLDPASGPDLRRARRPRRRIASAIAAGRSPRCVRVLAAPGRRVAP